MTKMKKYDHCEWFEADDKLHFEIIKHALEIAHWQEALQEMMFVACPSQNVASVHEELHKTVNEIKELVANAADAPGGRDAN